MRRVLIANRGEIALRLIRTCSERGLVTVLAHSTADADSLAARKADECVCIGPPPAEKSYLNIPAVVGAACAFRCDAIHPGYGFLSESPVLAKACGTAGVCFIGPEATTLTHLGDKILARQAAMDAGVPVIPGSTGEVRSAARAREVARGLGYPVLLKAAFGGGGLGIRGVENDAAMEREFASAAAEAKAAFGDARLYMEKLLHSMRHVEVQVLGDGRGNAVHLFERDCTLQRRRQKLIEEAPAILIDPSVRQSVREAAVRLARALHYKGAGTVEFLVRGTDMHFMEMNARLQVEHGITEMITGVDLVAAQLDVALKERLPWKQEEITIRGHAIECRINAEDPVTAAPCPGIVGNMALPGGPGVRVDSALFPGLEVSVWYDSLIAKIMVAHETRELALARMLRCLKETRIEGLAVNLEMHKAMLLEDRFANAGV